MKKIIYIGLMFVLIVSVNGYGQGFDEESDISVNATPVISFNESTHGYIELRVYAKNESTEKAHHVEIQWPAFSYGSGNHIAGITRSFDIAPDEQVNVSLFHPPLESYSGALGVWVDGKRIQNSEIGRNMRHGNSDARQTAGLDVAVSPDVIGVMISDGSETNSFVNIARKSLQRQGSMAYLASGTEIIRTEIPLQDWSANWLAYTSADGIFVTAKEIDDCSATIREALFQYVECGGILLVLGDWQMPQGYAQRQIKDAGLEYNYIGFGKCIIASEPDKINWHQSIWNTLFSSCLNSGRPFNRMQTADGANNYFPVVGELTVPVTGLFFVVLLFALLVGPLNMLFFAKKGYRIRLLWTVPLVAIVASLGVFMYSMFSEGFGGHKRSSTITILNEKVGHATTIGWLGYYSPLTPSEGLTFDRNSELTPQVATNYRQGGTPKTIDLNETQHFDSGWISARVPSHFRIRKSQKLWIGKTNNLEHLNVNYGPDGKVVSIANRLGVALQSLVLCDKSGDIYSLKNVNITDTFKVEKPIAKYSDTNTTVTLTDMYSNQRGWKNTIEMIAKTPIGALTPGTYVAVMKQTPYVSDGLADAEDSEDSLHVIYGIMN